MDYLLKVKTIAAALRSYARRISRDIKHKERKIRGHETSTEELNKRKKRLEYVLELEKEFNAKGNEDGGI